MTADKLYKIRQSNVMFSMFGNHFLCQQNLSIGITDNTELKDKARDLTSLKQNMLTCETHDLN